MNLLGKALRFVYGLVWHPSVFGDSDSVGPHGVSVATVGVSALAQDLLNFESTLEVPEGLSNHVVSSRKAQASWYEKLLVAWKESNPPPKTPEEASRLVLQTLKNNQMADVEGLLAFYGLPLVHTPVETTAEVPAALPEGVVHEFHTLPVMNPAEVPAALPEGVAYEFHTLPVDVRAVPDGDGITVYVSTSDPRESRLVPLEVQIAALERSEARAQRDYTRADSLHKSVIKAGYRVIHDQNEEVLARKYRIRLRGIDAPEVEMPYGKEAKDELAKIVGGKCLRILVYGEDQYGRSVGDIYCDGNFVQELMLKKGMVWHYPAYDQRAELAKWEKNARAQRVGLWASPNPEEPWEWRKKNKREEKIFDAISVPARMCENPSIARHVASGPTMSESFESSPSSCLSVSTPSMVKKCSCQQKKQANLFFDFEKKKQANLFFDFDQ